MKVFIENMTRKKKVSGDREKRGGAAKEKRATIRSNDR